MRHDAHTGGVLVYQDVVGSFVRAVREQDRGAVLVIVAELKGENTWDDGLGEPLGEGVVEQGVLDEFGGPCLESAAG